MIKVEYNHGDVVPVDTSKTAKRFSCHLCPYTTKYKAHLNVHILTHSSERNFPCDQCEYSGKTANTLRNHRKMVHSKTIHQCPECDFVTKNYLSIRLHIRNRHREATKLYKCDLCEFETKHLNSLKCHKTTHFDEKPLKCETCDFTTKHAASLRYHVTSVHMKIKKYQCKQCNFRASNLSNLRQHEWTHNEPGKYECEICHEVLKNHRILKVHMRNRHSGMKPHICPVCGKAFSNSHNMKRHMRIHKPRTNDIYCDMCPQTFTFIENLRRHVKFLHSNLEKPQCSECGKKFYGKANLARHMETVHHKKRNYICPVCNKSYTSPECLKRHLFIHDFKEDISRPEPVEGQTQYINGIPRKKYVSILQKIKQKQTDFKLLAMPYVCAYQTPCFLTEEEKEKLFTVNKITLNGEIMQRIAKLPHKNKNISPPITQYCKLRPKVTHHRSVNEGGMNESVTSGVSDYVVGPTDSSVHIVGGPVPNMVTNNHISQVFATDEREGTESTVFVKIEVMDDQYEQHNTYSTIAIEPVLTQSLTNTALESQSCSFNLGNIIIKQEVTDDGTLPKVINVKSKKTTKGKRKKSGGKVNVVSLVKKNGEKVSKGKSTNVKEKKKRTVKEKIVSPTAGTVTLNKDGTPRKKRLKKINQANLNVTGNVKDNQGMIMQKQFDFQASEIINTEASKNKTKRVYKKRVPTKSKVGVNGKETRVGMSYEGQEVENSQVCPVQAKDVLLSDCNTGMFKKKRNKRSKQSKNSNADGSFNNKIVVQQGIEYDTTSGQSKYDLIGSDMMNNNKPLNTSDALFQLNPAQLFPEVYLERCNQNCGNYTPLLDVEAINQKDGCSNDVVLSQKKERSKKKSKSGLKESNVWNKILDIATVTGKTNESSHENNVNGECVKEEKQRSRKQSSPNKRGLKSVNKRSVNLTPVNDVTKFGKKRKRKVFDNDCISSVEENRTGSETVCCITDVQGSTDLLLKEQPIKVISHQSDNVPDKQEIIDKNSKKREMKVQRNTYEQFMVKKPSKEQDVIDTVVLNTCISDDVHMQLVSDPIEESDDEDFTKGPTLLKTEVKIVKESDMDTVRDAQEGLSKNPVRSSATDEEEKQKKDNLSNDSDEKGDLLGSINSIHINNTLENHLQNISLPIRQVSLGQESGISSAGISSVTHPSVLNHISVDADRNTQNNQPTNIPLNLDYTSAVEPHLLLNGPDNNTAGSDDIPVNQPATITTTVAAKLNDNIICGITKPPEDVKPVLVKDNTVFVAIGENGEIFALPQSEVVKVFDGSIDDLDQVNTVENASGSDTVESIPQLIGGNDFQFIAS